MLAAFKPLREIGCLETFYCPTILHRIASQWRFTKMANQEIFDKLRDAIVNQNVAGIAQLTKEALDAGIPPLDIITKGLIRWNENCR